MSPAAQRPREEAKQCGNPSERRALWTALRTLWEISANRRQRKCRCVLAGDHVSIEKRHARANFSGLQTCANRWTCPMCGPKIAAERASEIALALTAHHLSGGRVAMVTLTMRHSRAQRLSDLLAGLTGAWSAIRQDKRSRGLISELTCGWIKRLELTVGPNGWHPHLHVLVFLNPGTTDEQAEQLAEAMYAPWSRRLARSGLGLPIKRHGLRWKVLDLTTAHEKVAQYVASTEYAAAPGSLSAALELANAGGKRARGENRTPMQLLADLVNVGLASDLAKWREYEEATRGKAQLLWSNGLRRRLLGALPETSDEEAAESNDLASGADLTLGTGGSAQLGRGVRRRRRHPRSDPPPAGSPPAG